MNNLTRRQFIRLGAVSGALALGLPLTGCTLADHSSLFEDRKMSPDRNQENNSAKQVNPINLNELNLLSEKMIADGLHPGAQLCVYHEGKLVIDMAEGLESPGGRPVTSQTLYQIRSTTKALTAMAMMMVYEKGRFTFEDPVAEHWPEFGTKGKESISIAQIMSHSAGLPDGPPIPAHKMGDRASVAAAVEAMEPV